MTQKRSRSRQGKRTPINQRQLIAIWHREGWPNGEIGAALVDKYGEDQAASIRVIQNITKEIRENRVPWNRLEAGGYDSGFILEVLADVHEKTNGKKAQFTQEEADWVMWVSKAAPDLPLYGVWMLAQLYMGETRSANPQFDQLDLFIGTRCWESLDSITAYADARMTIDPDGNSEGHIPQSHLMVEVASMIRQIVYDEEGDKELAEIEVLAASGDHTAKFALALYESIEDDFDGDSLGYQYTISDADLNQMKDNEELRRTLYDENDERRDADEKI